ncbi:MAG: BatD family protein, partial [Bacteroidota bacterium]
LGIAVNDKRRPRSFFSFRQLVNRAVRTEPVRLNVSPLPPDAPESFSGGVGRFRIRSTVSRNSLSTDDALSLQMTIDGNGDIKRVQAPDLLLSDDFEVYEPKVIEEKNFDAGGEIKAKKVVEYLVLPKKPGQYNLRPAFSYYDVDSAAYVTLSPERFPINVRKGNKTAANVAPKPQQEEAKEDIRFIKTETSLSQNGHPFFGSGIFVGLFLLPLLAFGGVLLYKQVLNSRSNLDVGAMKRRRALKQAEKRLTSAKLHMTQNEPKAFYDEVSRASFGYICDKLSIPFSELTKANVREKLELLQVQPSHIERFMQILQTCEMALFAGKDNAAAMQETYNGALEVIAQIEEDLA